MWSRSTHNYRDEAPVQVDIRLRAPDGLVHRHRYVHSEWKYTAQNRETECEMRDHVRWDGIALEPTDDAVTCLECLGAPP
jgi:hypothetical protein